MRITGPAKRVYGSLSAVPDVSATDVQSCVYATNPQDCISQKIGAGLKEQFLVQGLPFGGGLPPTVVSQLPGCLGSGGDLSKCSGGLLEVGVQLGPYSVNIPVELAGQISACALSGKGVVGCLSDNFDALLASKDITGIEGGNIVDVGTQSGQQCLAGDSVGCGDLAVIGFGAAVGGIAGASMAATFVGLVSLFDKGLFALFGQAHGTYPSEMLWQDIQNAAFKASGVNDLMLRIVDITEKTYGVYGLPAPWPNFQPTGNYDWNGQFCGTGYDPNNPSNTSQVCRDLTDAERVARKQNWPKIVLQDKANVIWNRVRAKYAQVHPDLIGGPQEIPQDSLYDTFFFSPSRGVYADMGTNQDTIKSAQDNITNWYVQTVIPAVRDAAAEVTKDIAAEAANASSVKAKLASSILQLNAQRQVLRQQKWNADEAAIVEHNKQGVWATDQQAQAILAQNNSQAAQIQAQATSRLNDANKKFTWAKDFAIVGLGAGALLALAAVISEVRHGND